MSCEPFCRFEDLELTFDNAIQCRTCYRLITSMSSTIDNFMLIKSAKKEIDDLTELVVDLHSKNEKMLELLNTLKDKLLDKTATPEEQKEFVGIINQRIPSW